MSEGTKAPPHQDPEVARAVYAFRSVPPCHISDIIKVLHFVGGGEDGKALKVLRSIPENVKARALADLRDAYGNPAP